MGTEPLISVVVPVYKTPESNLRACIESIMNQTYIHFEAILVDDGSPDRCGSICDEYAKKDSRIKVIHQQNQGVSKARNAGLKEASGDYLTFIDSDDFLEKGAWEKVMKVFKDQPTDCIVFGWNEINPSGTYQHQVTDEIKQIPAKEAVYFIASDNHLCGGGYPWNKIWDRKAILSKHGSVPGFDTELYTYEDKIWIIQVLQGLQTVTLIPDIFYGYNFVPTSLTQDQEAWKRRQFNAYEAYDKILGELKGKDKKAYEGALLFYFKFCYKDLTLIDKKRESERYKKTKRALGKICRRIKPGELHKLKHNLAWMYFLVFG